MNVDSFVEYWIQYIPTEYQSKFKGDAYSLINIYYGHGEETGFEQGYDQGRYEVASDYQSEW